MWGSGDEGVRGGERSALSRVDGDDLTTATANQENPVETFSQDLKELHVWEGAKVKENN